LAKTILQYVIYLVALADVQTDMFHDDVRGWMEESGVGNILVKVLSGDSDGGQ
jgi:hypothetical protein